MDIYCTVHGHPNNGIAIRKDRHVERGQADGLPFFFKGSCVSSPPTFRDIGAKRFIFEIDGMNDKDAEAINSGHADIVGRVKSIKEKGYVLRYAGIRDRHFFGDLIMIASDLPIILGAALIELYMNDVGDVKELVRTLTKKNPSGYKNPSARPFYPIRMGCFLYEMVADINQKSDTWVGVEDANGRHMKASDTGETVYYKIYSKHEFERFLFENSRLIIPAAPQHKCGIIERTEDGRYTTDLSTQLQFNLRTDGPASTLR